MSGKDVQIQKDEIRISVRNLVEFILRSGDIDNRFQGGAENAMAEGSRIHRSIQRRMGAEYEAEVFLRYVYETENYNINIEGRADGIITQEKADGVTVTIDEIKSTYRELAKIKEPAAEHLAQAKCYAYFYAQKQGLEEINIRMTYCNIDTEELKYFFVDMDTVQLEQWFEDMLEKYRKWADFTWEWNRLRKGSIEKLEFPFPYRDGQKELVTYVYQTIYHKKKLFIEAPTGVGKTISTIYPAVKSMAAGMCDKIFYLTAKTITRTVAEEAIHLLRQKGLKFKSVVLTAKEKICFMEETECNPVHCPYAKGHYNRINDAVYDLLVHADAFTRETIETFAKKHQVCPFELCLDMSLFADGVIGDYNYLFDPHVYLKRFFSDGIQGNYVFLVDEAHNLLERGSKMYSAELKKEDFLTLKKQIQTGSENSQRLRNFSARLEKNLEKCNKELLALKRECETYCVIEFIDPFVRSLMKLHTSMDEYLEEQDDNDVRKKILDFFFEINHFLAMYELLDDNYVIYTQMQEDGTFILKLFCVNPSVNLKNCMMRGRSTILFSATLLPIQYYKKLLGGTPEDYEVYAKSVFRPEKRALFIASDVTSKYTRRSEAEYFNIACYLHEIVKNRHGNYMAFFPSYSFLRQVYDQYMQAFKEETVECIVQEEHMQENEREQFLARFSGNADCDLNALIRMEIEVEEEKSLLGFCVLGGIFSEGIDLKNDSLIGAFVVGTGLPQVCGEREILKRYFDEKGENGFDYAYRFPGMNKVLQAAGRVIRTGEDVGIIALLDERFAQFSYQKMFPREWEHFEITDRHHIAKRVERFWDEWL